VLRACDKNGIRDFTSVLHVESSKKGSVLVATDGKRMHVAEIRTRLRAGNYKPQVSRDEVRLGMPVPNVQFPKWERVVPKDIIICGSFNPSNIPKRETDRIREFFKKLSGENVNPKYISDLTENPWVVYRQREKGKPLLLKEYGTAIKAYAVIMPLAHK
jgi:hypothetical protein